MKNFNASFKENKYAYIGFLLYMLLDPRGLLGEFANAYYGLPFALVVTPFVVLTILSIWKDKNKVDIPIAVAVYFATYTLHSMFDLGLFSYYAPYLYFGPLMIYGLLNDFGFWRFYEERLKISSVGLLKFKLSHVFAVFCALLVLLLIQNGNDGVGTLHFLYEPAIVVMLVACVVGVYYFFRMNLKGKVVSNKTLGKSVGLSLLTVLLSLFYIVMFAFGVVLFLLRDCC